MLCKLCGESREKMFYLSNKTKCKECVKEAVNKRRIEKIEEIREYDRNRPNAKERAEKHKERMRLLKTEDPDKFKKHEKQKANWSKKNRHKKNAHLRVQRALFNGILTRPSDCEHCEEKKQLEAHHEDYSKPLEVLWLCVECHNKRHVELNKEKRKNRD